jgi:hypothetical protein
MRVGEGVPRRIATGEGELLHPALSAEWLVWLESGAPSGPRIFAQRRDSGAPIGLGPAIAAPPQLYGERVLWAEELSGVVNRDAIRLYDLDSGESGTVAVQTATCESAAEVVFLVEATPGFQSHIPAVQAAIRAVADSMDVERTRVAVVIFAESSAPFHNGFTSDRQELRSWTDELVASFGETPDIGDALDEAAHLLSHSEPRPPSLVVVLTAGHPTRANDSFAVQAVERLRALGAKLAFVVPAADAQMQSLGTLGLREDELILAGGERELEMRAASALGQLQGCTAAPFAGYDLSDELIVRAMAAGTLPPEAGDAGVIVGYDARAITSLHNVSEYLTAFHIARTLTAAAQPGVTGLDVTWADDPAPGRATGRVRSVPVWREYTALLPVTRTSR